MTDQIGVRAVRLAIDVELWSGGLPPGRYRFTDVYGERGYTHFLFVCPCSCGRVSSVPVTQEKDSDSNAWLWDGNEEQPTLSPSLLNTDGCGWHGFLRDSVFKST